MKKKRILSFVRLGAFLLLPALTSGCTAKMRSYRHLRAADNYYAAGDFEKAKVEYLNVLRSNQQSAHAFLRSGEIWLDQGAPLRAGSFLYQATRLAPDDAEPKVKLARAYLALGAAGEAQRLGSAVIQQDPNNSDALLVLAETARTPDDIMQLGTVLQKMPNQNTMAVQVTSGALAARRGDVPGAQAAFGRASEIDPKAALPHSAMASIYIGQKNFPKAEEELKTAADLSSFRGSERTTYAQFLSQMGKTSEAEAVLKDVTKNAPDFIPPWRILAEMSLAQNKPDEGLAFLERPLALDPDNPDCRMVEANLLIAKGDGTKAIQTLERLNKTFANNPKIKLQLAKAHLLNNDLPAAGGVLTDTVNSNPNLIEAVLLLAQVNTRLGDLQKVVASMEGLLKRQPHMIEAEGILAEAYLQVGRPQEAIDLYKEQVKLNPERPQSWAAFGLALRRGNLPDSAVQAFEQTLQLVPQNTLALNQLVEIKIQKKDFTGALEAVDRQLAVVPDSARTYVAQGRVFVAQQQWDKAIPALRKAVELEPSLTSAYDLLIQSYTAGEKVPEAIAQLQEMIAKKPDNAPALMLLGSMYERSGDREKARDAYERAVAVKPDFAQAMNNLAWLYTQNNQLDRASDLVRKARALQPDDPSIADTLAWVLYKQGDYQQAFGLLQEAAPKLQDSPVAQFHLGMAAYMMGQKEVARTALSKAVEAQTDFPEKNEAKERIALLDAGGGNAPEVPVSQLEQLAQQQPSDTLLLMRLADGYEKQQDFAKAADASDRALKVNPKLIAPTLKLARYFAGPLKNKDKAMEYAKKARELAPADPDVAATLGQVAMDSSNYAWAYSLLKESARRRLEDPVLQHEYAWAAYDIGKVSEAKEAMQRVTATSTNGPEAQDAKLFLTLAGTSEIRGSEDLPGSAQVDEALRSNPNYTPALMVRAAQLRKSGDTNAAEKILNDVSARLPEFAPAQIALADIYVDDPAKIAAAADLIAKARKTLPDDPRATELLAEVSFQKKEYPRAIQLFQDAKRKTPLTARGMYHLGLSYAETKQAQQATDALNQALTTGLPEPLAAAAKQRLADLQKH